MTNYRSDQLKKNIQLIGFRAPVGMERLTILHTDHVVEFSPECSAMIDAYWEENHKGWTSSPISNFEAIYHGRDCEFIQTGLTEYKNQKGSDFLAGKGRLDVLDISQGMGNATMMKTADGKMIFGLRGSDMPICPGEYDAGGCFLTAMYAMENGAEKMRKKQHLPVNERFSYSELSFDFHNPLKHVVPRIAEEHGIKTEEIRKDTIKQIGIVRGIYGGRNPTNAIYVELDISAEEYLGKRREKLDWLENTTGKSQDKKRVEVEQVAFIDEDKDLIRFIAGAINEDALGRKLETHPMSGTPEVTDNTMGAVILYALHYQDRKLQDVRDYLPRGIKIETVSKDSSDAYRFKLNPEIIA